MAGDVDGDEVDLVDIVLMAYLHRICRHCHPPAERRIGLAQVERLGAHCYMMTCALMIRKCPLSGSIAVGLGGCDCC